MVGDVDSQLIRKEDAHLLAMYVQYFHTEEKGMNLIKKFSTEPQNFKYDDVIRAVETIGQWVKNEWKYLLKCQKT